MPPSKPQLEQDPLRYDGVWIGYDVPKSVFYPGRRRPRRLRSFQQVKPAKHKTKERQR
jgi:hypothetical protein